MGEIANDYPKVIPIVTLGDKKLPLDKAAAKVGYLNSGTWCRNMSELQGVISHGSIKLHISEEDALQIVQFLIQKGRAEEITQLDGSVSWNIHSLPEEKQSPPLKNVKMLQ
jgi:hypothetical protein